MPAGHAEKIENAAKQLASSDFKEREKGAAALLELGPHSYAAVIDATKSKDLETSRRAKEVATKLQGKFAKKDLKATNDDRIITPTFPIVGRILTSNIKIKADYFGQQDVSLASLRTLRSVGGPILEVDVKVDATKYGSRNREWLATSFEVDGRTAIVITAKGTIDLDPDFPGQVMCGPAGYRAGPGGFGKKGGGVKGAQGALVGKIGESGETFLIGDRFEGTPEKEGKLYLQINPGNYGPISTGAYDVKMSKKD